MNNNNVINDKPTSVKLKNKVRILAMTQVSLFCVLMIIAARMSLLSFPIPLTFQLPVAVLSGMLLGWKKGLLSQVLYLSIGLIGFPVFSAGGGITYLMMPSFGFLLGFPVAAAISGVLFDLFGAKKISNIKRILQSVVAGLLGIFACYILGALYFYILAQTVSSLSLDAMTLKDVVFAAVLPFIWKDILLIVPLSAMAVRLAPLIKKI